MPINLEALRDRILRADLDDLARLTLAGVAELDGEGGENVAAALIQATLLATEQGLAWDDAASEVSRGDRAQHEVLEAESARTCARTLALIALEDREAALRVVWRIAGGEIGQAFAAGAVWVAGPAGLAVWGGTSRPSGMTGWESSVEVSVWEDALWNLRRGRK